MPAQDRSEFVRRAHQQAFVHARTLAETAFSEADPLAAWACCGGGLAPTRLSSATLASARSSGRRARREAHDIDARHLELDEAVELRALQFGLERLERRAHGRPPSRTDPGHLIEGLLRVVEALETAGPGEAPARALERMGEEASAAEHDLGAASIPVLAAAADDLDALARRVEAIAEVSTELRDPAAATARSLREVAERWRFAAAKLPAAKPMAWNARVAPAERRPELARLPERMGSDALVALLETEEASAEPVPRMLEELGRVITRLRAMQASLPPPGTQTANTVSLERCALARARVQTWAESTNRVASDAPSCAAIVGSLGTRPLTDASLLVEVVRRAWVEPRAAKHRRDTGGVVALLEGRIAPASHRLAASIAATSGMDDADATRHALGEAQAAACLAATALWIHRDVEDETRLHALLASDCPDRSPDAWIAEAIARPRRSLDGVGLAFLAAGPAAIAALERYPWAPLGLVPVLADPKLLAESPPTPLRFELEELEAQSSRSTSAAATRAVR